MEPIPSAPFRTMCTYCAQSRGWVWCMRPAANKAHVTEFIMNNHIVKIRSEEVHKHKSNVEQTKCIADREEVGVVKNK
jgi:hypothetical protein